MSSTCLVASLPDRNAASLALADLKSSGFPIENFSVLRKFTSLASGGVQQSGPKDLCSQWSRTDRVFDGLWGVFFSGIVCSLRSVAPISVTGYLAGMLIASNHAWKTPRCCCQLDQALSEVGLVEGNIADSAEALNKGKTLLVGVGDVENSASTIAMAVKAATIAVCHCAEEPTHVVDAPF